MPANKNTLRHLSLTATHKWRYFTSQYVMREKEKKALSFYLSVLFNLNVFTFSS